MSCDHVFVPLNQLRGVLSHKHGFFLMKDGDFAAPFNGLPVAIAQRLGVKSARQASEK